MRAPTVVLSAVIHLGLAAGLVAMAQKREIRRRAISVAVTEEKKKKKATPSRPPPPPTRAAARPAPARTVASLPKAGPAAPVAKAAPAALATNLTLGNAGLDVGPGIGLHGRAPASAPAPVKVASAISEARTRRTREEASGEAPCEEEPTRPEPVFKTAIDYSVHPQAQADGIEGKLKLRFIVGADGEVVQVDVLSGIEPALDAAVVAAARQWRFRPALRCGKPVAGGSYVFAARFELGN